MGDGISVWFRDGVFTGTRAPHTRQLMTELVRAKTTVRVSNAHKLMTVLYAGSLLASTVAVFTGFAVWGGLISFQSVVGFLPPVVGTVVLTFIPATLIGFIAKEH